MSVKPEDEYMHPNTGEANFNESMYFNFYDRAASSAASSGRQSANERYAEIPIA